VVDVKIKNTVMHMVDANSGIIIETSYLLAKVISKCERHELPIEHTIYFSGLSFVVLRYTSKTFGSSSKVLEINTSTNPTVSLGPSSVKLSFIFMELKANCEAVALDMTEKRNQHKE
jgi:hypothetical protein